MLCFIKLILTFLNWLFGVMMIFFFSKLFIFPHYTEFVPKSEIKCLDSNLVRVFPVFLYDECIVWRIND